MAKAWSTFLDWVVPEVPGAALHVAQDAVREAAIRFCEESLVWVVDHPAVNIVAGTATYTLSPGAGMDPVSVVSAKFGAPGAVVSIFPKREDDLAALLGDDWETLPGLVEWFNQKDESTLRLIRIPGSSITGGLTLKVAVKPTKDASSVDDKIWRDYRQEIANGAKGALMMSQKKPYTNLDLGQYWLHQFEADIARAAGRRARSYTRVAFRTRPYYGIR